MFMMYCRERGSHAPASLTQTEIVKQDDDSDKKNTFF